jgi:hypothetical protein
VGRRGRDRVEHVAAMMHIIGSWAFDIAMGVLFVIWARGKTAKVVRSEEHEQ